MDNAQLNRKIASIMAMNQFLIWKRRRRRRKIIQYRLTALSYRRRAAQLTQVLLKIGLELQHQPIPRVWVKPRQGAWWNDVASHFDDVKWKETFRMSKESMKYIEDHIQCFFERQNTQLRRCIPLHKRVAVAIYTLTTVAEYGTVQYLFGIGKSTVCALLHTFCQAVAVTLRSTYICFPSGRETVRKVVKQFDELSGFPQCLGAVDICHFEFMSTEERLGLSNDKDSSRTSLLAVSDASCKFTYIDVSLKGSTSDSFLPIVELMKSSTLNAFATKIQGVSIPLCLVANSTVPSSEYLMMPYSEKDVMDDKQRSFNLHLYNAHIAIKTATSNLKARFRRIGKKLKVETRHIPNLVITCCILHNICCSLDDSINPEWVEDALEEQEQELREHISGGDNTRANEIRNALTKYLSEWNKPNFNH